MRVALLSLLERTLPDPVAPELGAPSPALALDSGVPRGCLRIAGRSVIRHQLALALALGCTRIIVLAEVLTGELSDVKAMAEEHGAQFHVLATGRNLLSLVAPEDDLIVLADGLLAFPEDGMAHLGKGPGQVSGHVLGQASGHGVLVMPVETGMSAGFERMDINNAWAGAMVIPGRIVAGLVDLPGDWNAQSALMRLAVQAGVRQVALPGNLTDEARWTLVRSEYEAQTIEPRWLRLHTVSRTGRSPGEELAAFFVHWLGPALLHAGTRPALVSLAGVVMVLLALGSGWLNWTALGFLLLGLAWLARRSAELLGRIDRDSILPFRARVPLGAIFDWSIDGLFVVLASWGSSIGKAEQSPLGLALFVPLVLFALLRIAPRLCLFARPGAVATRWLADRSLAGCVLAISALVGSIDTMMMSAVVLLLAGMLFWGRTEQTGAPNGALTKGG